VPREATHRPFSMSSRFLTRRLGGTWARPFSSSSPLRSAPRNGDSARAAPNAQQSPKWSGRSVFALTATAGLVGFGLAAAGLQTPPKTAPKLLDSRAPSPRYASLHEMEMVCSFASGDSFITPAKYSHRRWMRFVRRLAMTNTILYPRIQMICMRMAIQYGPRLTPTGCQLP
jgi:hypothetical protein